ncbi:MAG: hypothetical protein AAB489_02495 [Patescibacteria group bacterium]
MKSIHILLVSILLCAPLRAFGATPNGVSGIFAEMRGPDLFVRWNAPQEGADVASYRVYLSDESILENGGQYDDFETTDGPTPEHILRNPPQAFPLYVSVLAVNSEGEESRYFLEEVAIDTRGVGAPDPVEGPPSPSEVETTPEEDNGIPENGVPPQGWSMTEQLVEQGTEFVLLSVRAISATGVLLEFTLPPHVPTDQAREAFKITDGEGKELPIVRIRLLGPSLQLDTHPQIRNKAYILQVSSALTTAGSDGTLLSINPEGSKALFIGHETGLESEEPILPPDVRNLTLKSERSDTAYTVTAAWENTGSSENVSAFELRQSRDDGKTWNGPEKISAEITTVNVENVEPGRFSLAVRSVSPTGHTSQGVTVSITLAPIRKSDGLSDSGIGLAAVLATSGAIVGWKKARRS